MNDPMPFVRDLWAARLPNGVQINAERREDGFRIVANYADGPWAAVLVPWLGTFGNAQEMAAAYCPPLAAALEAELAKVRP